MYKFLFFSLSLLSTFPIVLRAQSTEQSLVIYRSNGKEDYFASSGIDSITWSCYDTDNQLHEQRVAVILHTKDARTYINIADIDSMKVLTLPSFCPDAHHPHAIDLGLPSGRKWACCNVGADVPEGFGGYFAWGETVEKDSYTWDNYSYSTYIADDKDYVCESLGDDIGGTGNDVAHLKWGGTWRMPSRDDYLELSNNCEILQTDYHGISGWLFTGPNGNSIFMPAAGWKIKATYHDVVNSWTSTLYGDPFKFRYAYFFTGVSLFNDYFFNVVYNERFSGKTVRPVNE